MIVIHGLKNSRAITLKTLPFFHAQGFPTLTVSYRNDDGVPPDPSGLHQMGITEWEDIEPAVDYALGKGAQGVILYGISMGGAIAANFIRMSEKSASVKALVFDCPVIDFRVSVKQNAAARYGEWIKSLIPLIFRLTERRFDIVWEKTDMTEAFRNIRVPSLFFHTVNDSWVPIAQSKNMVKQNPQHMALISFPVGEHIDGWNSDSQKYIESLKNFLSPF